MKKHQTQKNLDLVKRLKQELTTPEAQAFVSEAQAFVSDSKGTLMDFYLMKTAEAKTKLFNQI